MNTTAYIQHSAGPKGPFMTEAVQVKTTEAPRFYSATGYGARIPTAYMVKVENRWRRVYCVCFSNVGTLYIGKRSDKTIVQIND